MSFIGMKHLLEHCTIKNDYGKKIAKKLAKISTYKIPDNVKKIGSYAFNYCSSLKEIIISKSVIEIGNFAFPHSNSLISIKVDKGNKVYDSRDNYNGIIETATDTLIFGFSNAIIPKSVKKIGSFAYYSDKSLENIIIPDSVTEIGFHSFYSCEKLKNINIPNSVTSIDSDAFSFCKTLKSFYLPKNVKSIGNGIISGCKSIEKIIVDKENKYYDNRDNSNAIIRTKDNTLISGCNTTIIPDTITAIGEDAFSNLLITNVDIKRNIKSIGNYAFIGCDNLISVFISESVEYIGNWAFRYCNPDLIIYCEAKKQPMGWDPEWNADNNTVKWGYKDMKDADATDVTINIASKNN